MKTTTCCIVVLAFSSTTLSQTITLDQALTLAKENRPAIKAARYRLSASILKAKSTAAYPSSRLELGGTLPATAGGDDDLVLTQPINVFGRTSSLRRLASASSFAGEQEYRKILLEIQTEVLNAYAEAVAANKKAQSAEGLLNSAKQLHQSVSRKVEEGTTPAVQLQRSQIELKREEQQLSKANAELVAALEKLAVATGIDKRPSLPDKHHHLSVIKNASADNHPIIEALKGGVLKTKAEAAIHSMSNLPELELQGRREGWGDGASQFGVRLQLTWLLVDHGKAKFDKSASIAKANAFQQDVLDAKRTIDGELKVLNNLLESKAQQVAAYSVINESVKDLVEKTRRAYEEGVGTFIDLIDANRTLRESEIDLIKAELEFDLTIIRQYVAAGRLVKEMN